MGLGDIILFMVITIILITLLATNVRIVPQTKVFIIERLGAYHSTWGTGVHLKIPVVDAINSVISLKEQVADFPPQPVITKDNVTMQIDTIVYFQVTDPKLYAYGINNPIIAIESLTATTLRNIVGDLELDQTLTSRDVINTKMRAVLDEATDPWGIKVNRVELKNIMPPEAIRMSMEKQMKAERERRESILQAEGQKQSQILVAEGEKQSKILEAEAEKQSRILSAEGEKESQILMALGEAAAIREVQKAMADGIQMLNASDPTSKVLTIKSLEAFAKVADGRATKIIIPSEIQGLAGLAGLAASLKETIAESTEV